MAVARDEHERTLAFAEIALGQIQALSQAASPRNFEIWYHYATGYSPALNQSINETLANKGTLSDADLDQIYNTYIATTRIGDRIDTVNARVIDEIKQVLDMIGAAAGSATSYSESLADASEKLEARQRRRRASHHHRTAAAGRQGDGAQQQEARSAAVGVEAGDRAAAAKSRSGADRKLHRSAHDAGEPQILRPGARQGASPKQKHKDEPLSLLMTDIDHFKSFNDKYGHLTGDQVLRLVALAVKQNVKGQDVAARYGGEEFVIALPKTALRSATTVADHIRRAVMTKELMKRSSGERLGRVTISIGVALLRPSDTAQSLIERADNCLYAAKRNGRNRVICEADPEADGGGKLGAGARGVIVRILRGSLREHLKMTVNVQACCRLLRLGAGSPRAGSSCTNSPQPQAEVWFGLLKTNWADSLSTL